MFKKIIYLLCLFPFKIFAATSEFVCTNCKDEINVPIGASNVYMPNWFIYMLIIPMVIVVVEIFLRNKLMSPIKYTGYALVVLILVLFGVHHLLENYDKDNKNTLVGSYLLNKEVLTFKIDNDNKLLLTKDKSEMESIGVYFYNEKNDLYILFQNKSFYKVDFKAKNITKLIKIAI